MSHPVACDTRARSPLYAEVAVVPAIPGKDVLSYRVPEAARDTVRPGMRVLVPLGRRRETGIVVGLTDTPACAVAAIRPVGEVLDAEPILTPDLFALCRWTARYYVTTLTEVLGAVLPGGLRASSTRLVRLADAPAARVARGPIEAAILTHLDAAGPATTTQLARALSRPGVAGAVRGLARRGAVVLEDVLRGPAGATRYARVFALARAPAEGEADLLARRAPAQHLVYARLHAAADGRLAADALTPAERVAARGLVRRGLAACVREERYRAARPALGPAVPPPVLTGEQEHAVERVTGTSGFQAFLLHGVTGSGKTEVYLRLADRALAAGRSALLLVPEIALTHQLVQRVQERFGERVALLHSGLAPGERWDEWRRVLRGEALVVVGTRSAVFAPLAALGLVIVDEEHDSAYKQDEGLRYHARDLALVRAKLAGVPAILGSATPSIESYQQALDGKFHLLALTSRVAGRPLPAIELVDLRARSAPTSGARDEGESRLFSPTLLAAMDATLARGEQVLLFLNRRGFAKILQCLGCGEPAGCPSCAVTLTWHQRRGVLLCHHCGFTRPATTECAHCHGELRALADGTERIEADVVRRFPAARVARLDRDTTASKGAHQRILDAWRGGTIDVLIGTQMVAKGHDVPGVTLVGVLLADVALNLPDFRAGERAFQLLTQAAGRAGRGAAAGRVVVQTFRPEHHSLVTAARHDYAAFAAHELALRREVGYPPFERLALLRVEGADARTTERAALDLAAWSRRAGADGLRARGPAPAPLERLRGRWRWQLLLASPSAHTLNAALRRVLGAWHAAPAHRGIRLVVDIDPASML